MGVHRDCLLVPGGSVRDGEALVPAHGLLQARLLLGLEEGMVLERVFDEVALEREGWFQLRVLTLQLEMLLDGFGEQRRRLDRHRVLRRRLRGERKRAIVATYQAHRITPLSRPSRLRRR